MVRNSLAYANWKERKLVAADLRPIYQAATFQGGPQLATSLNHFMLLYANRIEAAWQRRL
jgi:transposase-like protein